MTRGTWAIVIVAAAVITTVGLLLANARGKSADVSVVGCLELEEDYRARTEARERAPEIDVDDPEEFVLSGSAPTPDQNPAVRAAAAYRLTGDLEEELVRQVGRKVEVVGAVRNADAKPVAPADADDLPELAVKVWQSSDEVCSPPDQAPIAR